MQISLGSNYGPLPQGLNFNLPRGYVVVIGENNVGKSALLQFIFKDLIQKGVNKTQEICFIPKTRDFIQNSVSVQESFLEFNRKLLGKVNSNPLKHQNVTDLNFPNLYNGLLNYFGYSKTFNAIQDLLKTDGFGYYDIVRNQVQVINDVEIVNHGSALRGLMPIYASIVQPELKYVIIDEPEASLEPKMQKSLKNHFLSLTKSHNKTIIVATHSHLFLNYDETQNNFVLSKSESGTKIEPLKNRNQFQGVAFEMLGNSFSDLYLPDNFLFVEGASDQIITEKIFELMEVSDFDLRIISCGGLQEVKPTIASMERNLRPIIEGKSPYSKLIVALVDTPNQDDKDKVKRVEELRKFLEADGRFFQINEEGLEEYLDESLYEKAGLNKLDEISNIKSIKDYKKKAAAKKNISRLIASKLEKSDLQKLEKIVEAIQRAVST